MKYIAVLDSDTKLSKEVIEEIKGTVFCGDDQAPYCFDIDSIEEVTDQTCKKGKWIPPKHDDGMSDPIEYQVRCSVCGFDIDPQTYAMEFKRFGADKYCPKCGSRNGE